MSENTELSITELAALVRNLQARVEELEANVTHLHDSQPVPEEDLMAIAAAAAAYMGYKGSVRAVSYANQTGWRAAGRRHRTSNVVRGTMPGAY